MKKIEMTTPDFTPKSTNKDYDDSIADHSEDIEQYRTEKFIWG